MFGRDLHVVVEDEAGARATVPAVLAAAGIEAGEMHQVEPSLEDVFVARVRAAGGAVVD